MSPQLPSLNHIAAIALGSNLDSAHGERAANLAAAIEYLRELGNVLAVSSFYDTAPVGYLDQPRFLNAAVLLGTTLPPRDLLERLLTIEKALGRDRSLSVPKGPRVIDLDLILFDDLVLKSDTLIIPHPSMRERQFVLLPLAEIAPTLIDPVTQLTIAALLKNAEAASLP